MSRHESAALPSTGRSHGVLFHRITFAAASADHAEALVAVRIDRCYARHGFSLVEQGEFDNYYSRPSQGSLQSAMNGHRFNVFGSIFLIRREAGLWQAYAVGADGKRSPAGFVVPDFIEEGELEQYLFDLFHERATPGNGDVRRIS